MQAIEAWKEGHPLDETATHPPELAQALEKWGFYKPR
jgi:ribulose-bisphosphate carboxylase large chain